MSAPGTATKRSPRRGRKAKTTTATTPAFGAAATDDDAALIAAAAATVVAAPPLFFSLGRARFARPLRLNKVIAIQLPIQHVRSKEALHEFILKKMLHRPFAMSAEERSQATPVATTTNVGDDDAEESADTTNSTHNADTAAMRKEEEEDEDDTAATAVPKDVYVVVHIDSIEPHADTVRQANARGDIQLNAMVTLTVAAVRHGVLFGCSEASIYEDCMSVTVPVEEKDEEEENKARKRARSSSDAVPHDTALQHRSLRITVRCLPEEPVVGGQAVFVVSEPGGSIRCMAVRPPRKAPGPFKLVAAEAADTARLASKRFTGGNKRVAAAALAATVAARVPGAVEVECEMPPKEDGVAPGARRGRLEKRDTA